MANFDPSAAYLANSATMSSIFSPTNRSLPSQIPPTPPPPPPSNGNRTTLNNNLPSRSSVPGKHCWVCFATDEDDYSACWVSPCRCRGTAKWVHQECLQRWVDEKQQGSSGGWSSFLLSVIHSMLDFDLFILVKVACPQCNTEYLIVYPKQGKNRLNDAMIFEIRFFLFSRSISLLSGSDRTYSQSILSISCRWYSRWISVLDCSDLRCSHSHAGERNLHHQLYSYEEEFFSR